MVFFLNNKSREGNKSYELEIEVLVCLFLQDQDLILYKKPKDFIKYFYCKKYIYILNLIQTSLKSILLVKNKIREKINGNVL